MLGHNETTLLLDADRHLSGRTARMGSYRMVGDRRRASGATWLHGICKGSRQGAHMRCGFATLCPSLYGPAASGIRQADRRLRAVSGSQLLPAYLGAVGQSAGWSGHALLGQTPDIRDVADFGPDASYNLYTRPPSRRLSPSTWRRSLRSRPRLSRTARRTFSRSGASSRRAETRTRGKLPGTI